MIVNKKNIIISLILIVLLWLSLVGQYISIFDNIEESLIYAFADLAICSFILMIIPLIFRIINNKTLSYEYGKKVCKYNSIIIFVICIILNFIFNNTNYIGIGVLGALIYYFINMSFFAYSKHDNEKNNSSVPLYIAIGTIGLFFITIVFTICHFLFNNTTPKEIGQGILEDIPYIIEDNGVKIYRASHILVEDLETAKKIITELNKGTSFTYLAKLYSTDASTSQNGGDLGNFYEGDMVIEFDEAVDSLEVNQYTNIPIKTDYGYHIIKRTRP